MASSQESVRALQEVAAFASRLGGGKVRNFTPWCVHAMSMLHHARETLVGIAILLEKGRPIPALTLSRPLFEDALRLAEYAESDPQERMAKVASWSFESLTRLEGLTREAARYGVDEDLDTTYEFVKRKRAEIDRACSTAGVERRARFSGPVEAAASHERKEDVINYLMNQQSAHSNDFIHAMFRQKGDDDVVYVGDTPEWLAEGIAGFAARRAFSWLTRTMAWWGRLLPKSSRPSMTG